MAYGPKKDEVYGALTFYRELAYFITRGEEYQRALKYYNEAISKSPTDKRTLMGRAWARSKVCRYQEALDDIAKALSLTTDDLLLLAQKALNTYLCCNFEDALVLNYRMVSKRKKPDSFVMGILHCSEAIENCIGKRAGHPLRDHFKIIRQLGWKKLREAEKPLQLQGKNKMKRRKKKKKKKHGAKKKVEGEPIVPLIKTKPTKSIRSGTTETFSLLEKANKTDEGKQQEAEQDTAFFPENEELCIRDSLYTIKTESDYVPPGPPFPFRPLQRYTTNIENYMAERYLDKMYLDKIFLKSLKLHPGIKSPNKGGTKKIIRMSRDGFKLLSYKQELLRTRRPFYFIKYQEAIPSPALKQRIQAELRKMQALSKREADALLDKIKDSICTKQTQAAVETAEKLKQFCDFQQKKVLPTRDEYLQEMYKLIAEAYYQLYRINEDQHEWDQIKRIYNWLGAPCSREPSMDSVIEQFKGVHIDWAKQIIVYEDRLRKATTPEEMCWLYHELARYNTEVKHFQLARVYARKCVMEAGIAKSVHWMINGMMTIAKINMLQHNRNDAKAELNQALTFATEIEDKTLVLYIEKCLDVVDKIDFGDVYGAKILEKREKQIIQMMASSGMKDEVSHLFRKMSVMPSTRRMSVMPGVRLEDQVKATATTRKMSILPTAKSTAALGTPRMVGTPVKKEAEAGEQATGVGFMKLIQYHVD